RTLDSFSPVRMGHHAEALVCGLLHAHGQLLIRELRMLRVVTGRHDATRGTHLDDVGAGANDLPHPLAHLIDSVDDRVGPTRMRDQQTLQVTVHVPSVGVAAGLAEYRNRDAHPGSGETARLHRGLDTKVDTATVANRGDPAVQQLLEIGFRREELHRERLLLNALQVHAVVLRVNVAIEQARGEQGIRRVDDGLAVDSRYFARDLADAAML